MMQNNCKTREMFIVRALEKILADRDVKRSHLTQLRKSCESALGKLNFSTLISHNFVFFDFHQTTYAMKSKRDRSVRAKKLLPTRSHSLKAILI